ncbi:MAG: hypothetical protein O3C61_07630 [Proteobacteria bacterium]|nr:hypothetical protein [Pseudomonadota bacterium]
MLKIRFHKSILLIPIIFSIFIFSQIEISNVYSNIDLSYEHNLYKYPDSFINVSYLSKLEIIKNNQKYLLEINTCLSSSNSDDCINIESEVFSSSLDNCEKEGKKVFQDSFDLRSNGIEIEYICKKIPIDRYANLDILTNRI